MAVAEAAQGQAGGRGGRDAAAPGAPWPLMRGPDFPEPVPHILDLLEPHFASPAVAVADPEGTVSYAELAAMAGGVAEHLRKAGVQTGEPVVVHGGGTRWSVAAMVGVLCAGARFVPVDAAFPAARQRQTAEASGARIVLAEDGLPELRPGAETTVIAACGQADAGTEVEVARGPYAYTCFTSGSTGVPKPVVVSAQALGYSTAARLAYYGAPVRGFVLASSIAFDSSAAGIWWTLASGGRLILPGARTGDLLALARAAESPDASHLLLVPSLYAIALRGGLGARLGGLAAVIVAGEACPPDLVGRHFAALPETALYNEYGPTECTVWSTVHRCVPEDADGPAVPIGRPIPGATVYLRPAEADDGSAELIVSGPGLAEGDVGVTVLPDADGPPVRAYPTGDLVALREDGALVFRGRADLQVKLGGMRVERAEIESAVASFDGVAEAGAGIAYAGERVRVVAFTALDTAPDAPLDTAPGTAVDAALGSAPDAAGSGAPLDRRALRAHLAERLPAAAVPGRVVVVPALPRLPNGKVDHGELDRRASGADAGP
ncbi:AMP-binding protein [Yinghuangia soli]|uniref:AMP-binding protein n=1 Tax=Yinghuangia soli TaxID=2908204 RepID=A0AA41U1B7_9ACTN|nr:AMP-binding protein [Yinghuangia soli]MCF2527372.1 AMP-binding protein [Yinghuangia soli]